MKVTITGHSDDLIYVDTDGKVTEIGAYHDKLIEVRSLGGALGVRIHGTYDGCWSFGVGQIEEGVSLPSGWTFAIAAGHPYSTRLVIDTNGELVEITRKGGRALLEDD